MYCSDSGLVNYSWRNVVTICDATQRFEGIPHTHNALHITCDA